MFGGSLASGGIEATVALDWLPDAVLVLDEAMVVRWANAAACEALGRQREALIGTPLVELLAGDPGQSARSVADLAARQGAEAVRAAFVRQGAAPLNVELRSCLTRLGGDAEQLFWCCTARPLAQHLATERALRESEEQYRSLYETAQVGLFRTRLSDGLVLKANNRAALLMNYPSAEALIHAGVTMGRHYSPDRRQELVRRLERDGQVSDFEISVTREDGSQVELSLSATVFPERGYLEGAVVDITPRKQALSAAERSERTFRNIIQATPLGVHMYRLEEDGTLRFEGANPAADRILGIDHSAMVGLPVEQAFPGVADSSLPDRYRAAAKRGEPWQTEQISYQDERISGAFDVYAFQTSAGRMVAMFADVTERKQTEAELARYRTKLEELVAERTRELEEAQQELVQAERLATLGQVTATVSHELRNPLATVRTAIFSVADALQQNSPQTVPRALDLAERSVLRCDRIIGELLDFTRTRQLEPQELAVDPWLDGLLDELVPQLGVPVERDLRGGIQLSFDPEKLRQAVVNVVVNAAQACAGIPAGRVRVRSALARRRPGRVLELSVEDNGPGIAPELLDRVLEPLFSTKGFGVGLGLPIAHNVMDQHGGELELHRPPGGGTRVVLWLPAAPGPEQE